MPMCLWHIIFFRKDKVMEGNRYIELFGKNVPIRTIGCSLNGAPPAFMSPPRYNLFIQAESTCNADCEFCEYHHKERKPFDVGKLGTIIKEMHSRADIGKINFTGGEPTVDMAKFDEIVSCVKENIDWKRKPEVTLNTNGIHLMHLAKYEDFIDYIGLSRHHYNNKKNEEIFKSDLVANTDTIKKFQSIVHRNKMVQLRCNLILGQIDSYDGLVSYLEHAVDIDINDCGFVTLMPINQFCNTHQVDFPSLIKMNEDLIEVARWTRFDEITEKEELCQCSNYIYSSKDGKFCRFYRRHFCNCNLNAGQLTYDGEYLRFGFGGEIIF